MDLQTIYSNLCIYDSRNPNYTGHLDPDVPEPRKDCCCDNCFYGRDALAMEILRLRADDHVEMPAQASAPHIGKDVDAESRID